MSDLTLSADVRTDLSTRQTTLKWVIVVDRALPAGLLVNAAACVSAAVGRNLPELIGPDGEDAGGVRHRGLPWMGCPVLAADADTLRAVHAGAVARGDELLVVGMSQLAQNARVYDAYLDELAGTKGEDLAYRAIGLVGPRKAVDRLVGGLGLLR
ncbi:DUF2000 domain-containing protein [Allostreptomyces psammosilenae]|uniref:DUF2000 domain-containing protein n=1 Tax=Allostreptomyces psammosilenae TaxID=1892865 RepID=A0A852ZXK1_9ACTN|nr:DUF2000 domain-containing protein [Allostreptomyces psammosilenae]NYI06755.1 hypothetical protein [Allostreptomyces psammosilenae]